MNGRPVEQADDKELLSAILSTAVPAHDTGSLAAMLLNCFGSLANVLGASRASLARVAGQTEDFAWLLKAVAEAARRMALEDIAERPVLDCRNEVLAYCRVAMGRERIEQFRLLYLDGKNHLIVDEVQQRGTVNHTPVYPREVVKRALELDASGLIMVHNHPSGDPTPSLADIEMTRAIKAAAATMGIELHDHIVIGRRGHRSFRSMGLL